MDVAAGIQKGLKGLQDAAFRWQPRIKDFQGISKRGFDGRGNYNLGLKEQLLFPEIDYDKVIRQRGMNITFVTTAKADEEAQALLAELGMPFAH